MNLPSTERRKIEQVTKRVVWLYGSPFSGKTTFANKFETPLMLNTDGNIRFVDSPVIPIRDHVRTEGRMIKRTLAWDVFKETVAELEKKENDFKTIIVDLLEDNYDFCRLWVYDQMNITHESDDMKAWDKVMMEFLSTLKRLMSCDYENIILISHEDISKDIFKKGGDKVTAIRPNLREKVANKVAGMVDIVARVVADGSIRMLNFKSNEVIFGGGRLHSNTTEIPLSYKDFIDFYGSANASGDGRRAQTDTTDRNRRRHDAEAQKTEYTQIAEDTAQEGESAAPEPPAPTPATEQPRQRKRRA